jgi:CBS domain-containing protein
LRRIRASEALTPLTTTVRADASLVEVEEAFYHDELRASAVVDDKGTLVGEICADDIANLPHEALAEKKVTDVMVSSPSVIYESDPLDKALELLGERRVPWLLVVDNEHSRHPLGTISTASIAETYTSSLNQQSNWIAQLAREAKMLEQDVEVGSPLDGQTLSEAKLPAGALVVALRRSGKLIIPNGATHLKAGDQILALIHRPLAKQVKALIEQQ